MEHYSEDGNSYEDEIADMMDLRQVLLSVVFSNIYIYISIQAIQTELNSVYSLSLFYVRLVERQVEMRKEWSSWRNTSVIFL